MNAPIRNNAPQMQPGLDGNALSPVLSLDIPWMLRTFRKWLSVIVGVSIGLTAIAAIAVFQITPRYTAEALVLIDPQRTQVMDVESVMSGLGSDTSTIQSQVAILQSRAIARRVAEKENLIEDPEFNSSLSAPSAFRFVDPYYWFAGSKTATLAIDKDAAYEARMNSIVGRLVRSTEVSRIGLTYILAIKFTSIDKTKAARIANEIANVYIVDQLEAKFEATRQANEWLANRLADLRTQVEISERAVEIYRSENGLQSSGKAGVTINQQQLSELNAQLILAKTSLAEKQAKYQRAKQILSSGGSIESVVDVLQSTTISNLRAKEAELARQQAELSSKYGERHPAIVNTQAQRRDVERQIGAEVRRIVGSIQNEAAIAETRVASLQDSLNELQGTSGANDQASVRLNELEREAQANRTVYESFLNRYKETSQQQDIQTADARVLSKASIPNSASFPRRGIAVGVALILSIVIGVVIALLLEQLDNGIRTGIDVERILGLTHFVSIPEIPKDRGSGGRRLAPADYLLAKPLSAFSESLRSLRSALSLSNVDSPPKVILFTSALPNEGKTTTAVCFARASAQAGLRTILIDCDLRHPSVNKTLGHVNADQGLVDVLAGLASLEDVIIVDEQSQLHHIPIATGSSNPSDILGSVQMQNLIARLRQDYDFVILDSAPVLPVSDSRVLSRIVDKTVFVVLWNETPRDASINAVKSLQAASADIAGVVLTIVDTNKQARYGFGDGGYYYKRYSRYYAD